MLKIVRVEELADEAVFQNPCLSFVLTGKKPQTNFSNQFHNFLNFKIDVICTYCNTPHDLDLLRDPRIVDNPDKGK